ncbi:hypothetical protein GCM10028773_04230 [Spirosoma koreense]
MLLRAQDPAQLVGTWIGVHTEWDVHFYCALPAYIQLEPDSTYHLGLIDGSAREHTATWSANGGSVRLDTVRFARGLVTVQGDLLRIGTNYPMLFRRFTPIPIDSAKAFRQLSGSVWQSAHQIVYLYANGQAEVENPITKEHTTHFWQLARFGKSVFLVIRGNRLDRDGDYKSIWQVSGLTAKQLRAIGWNGYSVATETFQQVRNLSTADSCRSSGFQTCTNCFRSGWTSLTHGLERYDITQLFSQYYRAVDQSGESGLIRVQFVINCQGERGRFELSSFDEDYCPKTFDNRITKQLLAICQNWVVPSASTQEADNLDTRARDAIVSLTFRLKDGCLTDILP